jgi:transcriptional regulator with XRE-family HTH domain
MTAILTGAEVRAIRKELGMSQIELASALGYEGDYRRQRISRIELGHDTLTYAKANLLLAMREGFVPTGTPEIKQKPGEDRRPHRAIVYDPEHLPRRVISVLGDALNNGGIVRLGNSRMRDGLRRAGLLSSELVLERDTDRKIKVFTLTELAKFTIRKIEESTGPTHPTSRTWRAKKRR